MLQKRIHENISLCSVICHKYPDDICVNDLLKLSQPVTFSIIFCRIYCIIRQKLKHAAAAAHAHARTDTNTKLPFSIRSFSNAPFGVHENCFAKIDSEKTKRKHTEKQQQQKKKLKEEECFKVNFCNETMDCTLENFQQIEFFSLYMNCI